MRLSIVMFLLSFLAISLHGQSLSLRLKADYSYVDHTNRLIVVHDIQLSNYSELDKYKSLALTIDDKSFTFVNTPAAVSHSNHYMVTDGGTEYTLYFTTLPIVSIRSDKTIRDEPKDKADFSYVNGNKVIKSIIGIELRGGSSISYPKNTFDLEFWEDEITQASKDVQFGNLREDDDWILDGVYNEPLRIRSYVSHKLWLDIHTPYYIDKEEDAKAGVDVMYVEMFLNGQYNGVYLLSEQIDRKLLQLEKFKDKPRGELYKGNSVGVSTFDYLPNYNNASREWDSYSLKYPKEEEWTDWSSLYNFSSFVINAPNYDFQDSIWTKFNYDNYIDYFLYLNLLRMTDNTGKNIYVAKYDEGEPYFYVPWDLDGSFGLLWDGSYLPDTAGILTNGFHDRIIDSNPNRYNRVISNRWEELRVTTFSNESLLNRLTEVYKFLQDNNVYHREAAVHGNYNFGQDAVDYIEDWLTDRIKFLDRYFIDRTTSTIEQEYIPLIIYPNPVSHTIHLLSNAKRDNYKILNNQGQVVLSGSVSRYNSIDVSSLSSGTFYLKSGNAISKIIKL